MGDDELKSAYEIALERLAARGGAAAPKELTAEQKRRIAEVRREFAARRAELDVLEASGLRKAAEKADPEALARLREEYAADRRRLDEEEARRVEEIRAES